LMVGIREGRFVLPPLTDPDAAMVKHPADADGSEAESENGDEREPKTDSQRTDGHAQTEV
jgi:hypothetical protein